MFEIPEGFDYDPNGRIMENVPHDEAAYTKAVALWRENCFSEGILERIRTSAACFLSEGALNAILRMSRADVIEAEGGLSSVGDVAGALADANSNPNDFSLFGRALGEGLTQEAMTLTEEIPSPEIVHSALGTLLTPYLLIKWGDIVLHNTFPPDMTGGLPIINQNVSQWQLSMQNSSSGDGGGGQGGNTFKIVLNPVLVDGDGEPLKVQADGKAIDLIFGYPGSVMVRRHTFAQTQISDHFFNRQQTEVTFRGSEWNIQRFGQQRMYASGKWREMIETAFKSFCSDSGLLEEDCTLTIEPEEYEPSQVVSQQVQTGSNQEFIRYLVEDIGACRYSYNSENPHELELNIECEQGMNIPPSADLEKAYKIVDNGLWLGEHLVESISISGKIGEGQDSNFGNRCGGAFASQFPPNEILTSLSACGYGYNQRRGIIDRSRDSHYSIQFDEDGNTEVPILAPFSYTRAVINEDCENTASSDTTCNDGYGNYVEVTSTESATEGQTWRFYHLGSIGEVAFTGSAGVVTIGIQGRSGSATENAVGIRITDIDGNILPKEQTEAAVNEYVNTLTRECGGGIGWNGTMCYHQALVTSYIAAPFGPYHIHIDAGKETLPPFDAGVTALMQEYMDAATESGICVDMNGSGQGRCYTKGDTAAVRSCINAHGHSNVGYACDFWVSDPGTNRFDNSAEGRQFPDPWPQIGRSYYNFGASVEGACVYDNDVRIMHGEPRDVAPFVDQYFPANPWCSGGTGGADTANAVDPLPALSAAIGINTYEVEEITSDGRNTPQGGRYNVSDTDAAAITAWAQGKGLNPLLVAAFIQGESSFNPRAENSIGCYGIWQCCSPPNPCGSWGQYDCGDDYICQLDNLWDKYIPAQGCTINSSEDIYVCIAFPWCTNNDTDNLDTVVSRTCMGNEGWRDANGTCNCDGIRKYLRDNVIPDERFPDTEGVISGASASRNDDGSPCTPSGSSSQLNSPASNAGTGGINGIRFQEEVKLQASFGMNPRNMFISPTSPGSNTPQYILLGNADNSNGFIDFKITEVGLAWKGHWRWDITATRPGSDGVELPRTLKQPTSYEEWIRYYWYPDPEREAREFVASGTAAQFDRDTGSLVNAIDDEKASQDARATTDVGQTFSRIRTTLLDSEGLLLEGVESEERTQAEADLSQAVGNFRTACEAAAWNGCDRELEDFEQSEIFRSWRERLNIGGKTFRDWYYGELAEPVRTNIDRKEED